MGLRSSNKSSETPVEKIQYSIKKRTKLKKSKRIPKQKMRKKKKAFPHHSAKPTKKSLKKKFCQKTNPESSWKAFESLMSHLSF